MDKFRLILSLSLLFCGQALLFASSKIDTIYFQNGDRITAEVKKLENNQLTLSTDDASTIRVEWNKVDSVKILNNMRIFLDQGEIMYGKILPAGADGYGYIWRTAGDPLLVELVHIVSLFPIEDKFINRLSGTLSSGFSYVKASQVMQMNLNGSIEYQAKKNQIQLHYDGILTKDPESGNVQNQDGGATFMRILPNKWFLALTLSLESITELELDLRTTLGFGGGKSIIKTNFTHFYTGLGIQGTRENSKGEYQNNLEGIVVSSFSVFIYDDPEVSFDLSGDLMPSLSNLGRVRADIDSSLKWEIFNDFYLKWTFYYKFDSRTLSGSAENSDWAVTLLGVEYKL